MSRTRRAFTEGFKQQAVNLSKALGSGTKAAQELGINESLIRNWTKKSNSEKSLKAVDPAFSVEELKRLQQLTQNPVPSAERRPLTT